MNYFQFFKNSLLHPKRFFKNPKITLKASLVYFSINFFLYNLISLVVNSANQIKLATPFLITNQVLFTLPLTLVGILLLTTIFHLGAKLCQGSGSFKDSFRAVILTSALLVFTPLPIVGALAYFYQLFLLILAFRTLHHLPLMRAALVVIIPSLFLQVILIALSFSSLITT